MTTKYCISIYKTEYYWVENAYEERYQAGQTIKVETLKKSYTSEQSARRAIGQLLKYKHHTWNRFGYTEATYNIYEKPSTHTHFTKMTYKVEKEIN